MSAFEQDKSLPDKTRHLREAAAFLTVLSRSSAPPSPEAIAFFPVVGIGIGLCTGITWAALRHILDPLPAAVVAVAADIAVTGALHLDGVADTADGLLAHAPQQDRLAIMSEPEVGTFGTLALATTLLFRVSAMSALEPSPALVASLWCTSRSLMAIASRTVPYARTEGLASSLLPKDDAPDTTIRSAAVGLGASALLAYATNGRRGLSAVVAGGIAGWSVIAVARRRIGGFTGDVLGAAGTACETVGLLVGSVKASS